jgi:hypothetical protein
MRQRRFGPLLASTLSGAVFLNPLDIGAMPLKIHLQVWQEWKAPMKSNPTGSDDSDARKQTVAKSPVLENDSEEARRQEAWKMIEEFWRHSKFNSGGDRLTRDQLHERR